MNTEFKARGFNKQSYKSNDEPAKKLLIEFLKRNNHEIKRANENFEHDLITAKDNNFFIWEVEMKIGYKFTTKDTYQFNTVSFLGRKLRLHKIKPFFYVIICKETKWALMAHSNDIFINEYRELISVHVKDRTGNDEVYHVPKTKCKFFNLLE
jgi:hypothetical protein